jgi:rhodanese-related sulfurtransferase
VFPGKDESAALGTRKDLHMAKQHSPRFLKLVEETKKRVRETTVDEVKQRLDDKEPIHVIDVREESEWTKGHIPGATHLSKGVIERDIEQRFPNTMLELILYCGGGFRSALVADNLRKMGYTNVVSLAGGFREWQEKNYPIL